MENGFIIRSTKKTVLRCDQHFFLIANIYFDMYVIECIHYALMYIHYFIEVSLTL